MDSGLSSVSHDMEKFSISLVLCEGNPPVTVHKGPVMKGFVVFVNVSLNKLLNNEFAGDFRSHDADVTSLQCVLHYATFAKYLGRSINISS